MRRPLLFLLVLVCSIYLSSCLEIEDRLQLNKDGSGTQTLSVDLSKLLSNEFMRMALEAAAQDEGKNFAAERMDSTINIYDELGPVNPQWDEDEVALVKRATTQITMDMAAAQGVMVTQFSFDDLEELERYQDLLRDANQPEEDQTDDNPLSGLGQNSGIMSDFTLKNGKLIQESISLSSFGDLLGGGEELDENTMEMMKGLLEGAVIRRIIEFPGKIKKVTGYPGHVVDKNVLTVETTMLDLIDDPNLAASSASGEVKFKK